jgi:uncharacterized protein YbbK (DUF523 family)
MAGRIFVAVVAALVKGMSTRRAIDVAERFALIARRILTTMTHRSICVTIVAAANPLCPAITERGDKHGKTESG